MSVPDIYKRLIDGLIEKTVNNTIKWHAVERRPGEDRRFGCEIAGYHIHVNSSPGVERFELYRNFTSERNRIDEPIDDFSLPPGLFEVAQRNANMTAEVIKKIEDAIKAL